MSESAGDAADASLYGDSEPPQVEPTQVVRASTSAAASFWQDKGTSRKARRRASDAVVVEEETEQPEFTGISLVELEFSRAKNNDGAASSVASEAISTRNKKRRIKRKRGADRPSAADMMANAAFGGGGAAGTDDDDDGDDDGDDAERRNKDGDGADGARAGGALLRARVGPRDAERNQNIEEDEEEEEEDESLEDEDEDSVVGAGRKIRSDRCIGCCFDRDIIGKVDGFVRTHCVSMTETAVYRAASQFWHREIVKPRAQEGVRVPGWHWKDIANHYSLHAVDPLLQRASNLRVVNAMREFQSQKLLRVNTDGSKALDAKGADFMLKLIALSDKHISALDAARMPPPPPRGSR